MKFEPFRKAAAHSTTPPTKGLLRSLSRAYVDSAGWRRGLPVIVAAKTGSGANAKS
jgi:hypothetical protein